MPPEMLVVPGGVTGLGFPHTTGSPTLRSTAISSTGTRSQTRSVQDSSLMREVTSRREFWTEPFVKEGREIPWDEAVALLSRRNRTPRPSRHGRWAVTRTARRSIPSPASAGTRRRRTRGSWARPAHGVPLDACVAISGPPRSDRRRKQLPRRGDPTDWTSVAPSAASARLTWLAT